MAGTPRPPAVAVRRLAGAAAMLGLLAMHGLVAHAGSHCLDLGDVSPVHVGMTGAEHVAAAAVPAVADPAVAEQVTPVGTPAPDPDALGLVGLCLAVLVAGAAAAVLARRFRSATGLEARWAAVPVAPRTHERDPPCLHALSIQRC